MVLHDDEIYAVGSTIVEPPMVFLPPASGQDPASGFQLVPVQLVSGIGEFDGELWGIDVDDSGIVAVGVDQNRNVGHIFTSPADPYVDPWNDFDVSTIFPSDTTWMRGTCRRGSVVVAVGEFSQRLDAIVLLSEDGGATFADITPAGAPSPAQVHHPRRRLGERDGDGWVVRDLHARAVAERIGRGLIAPCTRPMAIDR